jgi:plastocyanin
LWEADPLFANASTGDFTLLPRSPAINVGTNPYTSFPVYDLTGNLVIDSYGDLTALTGGTLDMGAYEYVWLAPTITTISPSSGTTLGGTEVIITGTDFTGATSVTFGGEEATDFDIDSATQITAETPAHSAGAVDVVVVTPGGTDTETNGFTYIAPPTITAQPDSATVDPGDEVSFSLTATGGGTLSYQWKKDGSNISGATSSTYSINPVAEEDEGSYTCTVTNSAGSATSNPATLTVNDPASEEPAYTPPTEVKKAEIKLTTTQKFKNKIYSFLKKFTLKGSDSNLAGGQVKIYKNGKKTETVSIDNDGDWKQKLKLKNNFSGNIKLRYYDSLGNYIDSQTAKVKVDTEDPTFTSFIFPMKSITPEVTKLNWEAKDNQKIDRYKIYLGGRIYKTDYNTFQVPRESPRGMQKIKIKAYDKAGNSTSKETWVRVR